MKAVFTKSDAAAEAFPNEPDTTWEPIQDDAQITYGHLIRHGDDITLAVLDSSGFWTRPDGTHWSDVIFTEDETG